MKSHNALLSFFSVSAALLLSALPLGAQTQYPGAPAETGAQKSQQTQQPENQPGTPGPAGLDKGTQGGNTNMQGQSGSQSMPGTTESSQSNMSQGSMSQLSTSHSTMGKADVKKVQEALKDKEA